MSYTGNEPKFVTQLPAENSTKVATTAYVTAAVAAGGGGVSSDLSDLTPTAINEDLVSDKPSTFKIKSKDQTGANSEFVSLESGTGDSSGNVYVLSGDGAAGTSGEITLQTGNPSAGNASGGIILATGGNGTDDTGGILLSCSTTAGFRGGISMEASELQVNSMNIKGVADPVALDDAATKNYVDTAIAAVPVGVAVPALDIDWASGNVFYKSIAANQTFTFSNVTAGKVISVILINTSGSPVTATLPAGLIKAASFANIIPANATNVYTFIRANSITYASSLDGMV